MSNPETRRIALSEQKLHEKSQRMRKQIALEAERRSRQGEILGYMVGSVGDAVSGKQGSRMVSLIQTTLLLGFGGVAAYALILASN